MAFFTAVLIPFVFCFSQFDRMLSRDEIFNTDSKENPIDKFNSNFNLVSTKLLPENNINISNSTKKKSKFR